MVSIRFVGADACRRPLQMFFKAIPHNSKCRYGERGAADAKPKAQIILDAAKVSAASGGNSEPKQEQRSQSARGFCPRSTMRVPQPDIIEHFGNADAVPQLPERCLSRKAGIVRCCPNAFIDIFHLPNILIIPYLLFSPSNQKHPRSLPVSPGKGNGDAFYRFKPNQQSRCIKQAHRQRRAGHQPNG